MNNVKDRAKGAFIGALIGEALGVGPHWYYDLEVLRETYGAWINDYTEPKKGRYHGGLKAGELSQQGWIIKEMARYLSTNKGYDFNTFTQWMDDIILPQVSDDPLKGIGGYTSQMMRQVYHGRVIEKLDWNQVASIADTTESLERNIPTAIYYANDLKKLSLVIAENTALTQSDNVTGSMSVAYNVVLAYLIQGNPLDKNISGKLMKLVYKKELPFFAVTSENLGKPMVGRDVSDVNGLFASPDALLSPSHMAEAAEDPLIKIEPAWKASIVYGMPCAIYHMLPAVYYLSARFKDDFESGVLHAINGGGQNQVRAMLTGALIGAQVGLSGIPKRFIEGLKDHETLLKIADDLTNHLD
ncbi:MAG: ADP-ribosylglycohydrolase family protein [Candidatus Izemoplasmataceae bacterium]